jgi:hypothetical protein
MSIEFSWEIINLETKPFENNLLDVVKVIRCRYHATDGINTVSILGSFSIGSPVEETFISYENLTTSDVISWLESHPEIEEMRESLIDQLNRLKNPPTIRKLPWS